MSYKVYHPENVKNAEENEVFFNLREVEIGILLELVNKAGERIENGIIMELNKFIEGIIIMNNVSDSCPLKTDLDNSVLCILEDEFENRKEKYMKEQFLKKLSSDLKAQGKEQKCENQNHVH